MTADAVPDWVMRYAAALEVVLGEADGGALLDLARDVAHASERRAAPLSTFVAGVYVARRAQAGVPARQALAEAVATARDLLR